MWPIGFAIIDIGTTTLLEWAASASPKSDFLPGFAIESSVNVFFALIIAAWMVISTINTPKLTTKIITTGANAGSLILQSISSAVTLGATYGLTARGTAQLAGASPARVAAATALGGIGGVIAGATGSSGVLIPAVIGLSAAKSSIGGKDKGDEPTDYNAKADEIANRNK